MLTITQMHRTDSDSRAWDVQQDKEDQYGGSIMNIAYGPMIGQWRPQHSYYFYEYKIEPIRPQTNNYSPVIMLQ